MKFALPLAVLTALSLAACSSAPTQEPGTIDRTASPPTAVAPAPKPVAEAPKPKVNPYDPKFLKDPASLLSKRSVYFDYNSDVVQLDYFPALEQHSKYLKANKTAKMLIQGNTDERGSSEYNLALGQKRADAVKKTITLLGVPDAQIETVSLGKEKPKNPGHDEAAWAENRRADILYNGEY
ncbi:MAG TPA: peptidoglycan-associated lipoprotein Pal [Rhodocyclaceae bacterium]|nr:peptidoglycan-associated lipoprotein Pal [Rhodocyclaceae bacterium]